MYDESSRKYSLALNELLVDQMKDFFTEEEYEKDPVPCINYTIAAMKELEEGIPTFTEKIAN